MAEEVDGRLGRGHVAVMVMVIRMSLSEGYQVL